MHMHPFVCVKGGFQDMRDMVLYNAWQGIRGHAWNETDCHTASDDLMLLYFTLHI